ncbi:MAG: hypothetical protein JWN70_2768 [Planctomycetaceae bacterium]|nr:hypothetical protein [Planctomycetaceae bacterium]
MLRVPESAGCPCEGWDLFKPLALFGSNTAKRTNACGWQLANTVAERSRACTEDMGFLASPARIASYDNDLHPAGKSRADLFASAAVGMSISRAMRSSQTGL